MGDQVYGPVAPPSSGVHNTAKSDFICSDVPHMHAVLSQEKPTHTDPHSDSWYTIMTACNDLHTKLTAYRAALAAKWHGSAADLYLAALDNLIKTIDLTTTASNNTHRALATMSGAIAQGQDKMRPIMDRWNQYKADEEDYDDSFFMYKWFNDRPEHGQDRVNLNQEARVVMAQVGDAVFQSSTVMTPTPDYVPPAKFDGADTWGGGGSGGGSPRFPGVPPLPPQLAGPPPPDPRTVDGAPVLDGYSPTLPPMQTAPIIEPNTGTPLPPPVIGGSPGVYRTPGLGGQPVYGGQPGYGGGNGRGRGGLIGEPGRTGGLPGERGFGGTTPPMGGGGRPGAGATGGGQRVNPTGGLLGPNPGGRGRRRGDEPEQQRHAYDPDDIFAVDTSHAGPSVLQPDPEPEFRDSGPVIGADR